jgi:hypothetical protein
MATFSKFNEAETGSLALRLALLPHEASPDRVTPSHARSATCQTDNLQGELLSVHKIDQAWPGAPGFTGSSGYFYCVTFLKKVTHINLFSVKKGLRRVADIFFSDSPRNRENKQSE